MMVFGMNITSERLDIVKTLSLVSILVTAVGSYFTLKATVDTMQTDMKEGTKVREAAIESLRTQNQLLRDLFSKSQERMAVIETKLDTIKEQQDKLSSQVETYILEQRRNFQ